MPTHNHPKFKDKAFVATGEGQKAMFYGDTYFIHGMDQKGLPARKEHFGFDPVLTAKGEPTGAKVAVPSGKIVVLDKEKAARHRALILAESKRIKEYWAKTRRTVA